MIIDIEQVKVSDALEMINYFKKVGGESNNLTFGPEGLNISLEKEREHILRVNESHDDLLLVARYNNEIIANASLSRLKTKMRHRAVLGITVLKQYWNQGIAQKMMKKIIDHAKENNLEYIDLKVKADNFSAIHLYEKFGFKKIGLYPDYFKIDNQYFDVISMTLKIK